MQDQKMMIKFSEGVLEFWHKSEMGDLGAMFQLGNAYRLHQRQDAVLMANWIQRQDTQEYIALVSKEIGRPAVERKKGKGGGTYAHLKILIDAGSAMSAQFKSEIHDCFILQRVQVFRDMGGEEFKDMNNLLALAAESVLGKPAHTGHFIQLAKAIKARCQSPENWNTASPWQLQERCRLETALASFLKSGVVRDWEHLKELVGIV